MKTKSLYLAVALGMMLGFSSCNLDTFPSDELQSEALLQDVKGAEYIMDGCYAVLKDEVEFLGYASGNTYVRHYFQMAEYPADNICLCASSTDPLYEACAYMMNDGLKNVGTLWMVAYKAIYMCNTVIESLDANDPNNNQLLGEAYFMRGLMHLHLVTLHAKPYSFGRDNLGVPLRTSPVSDKTVRNSVGEVYDQIAADLRKAADLMSVDGRVKGNYGYPRKEAALGLLSRVYLYMEKWDDCIAVVNEALNGADPASKLEPTATFGQYFANAKTSPETLFCIAHEMTDDRKQSSIGSMYNGDGGGWGEVYASDPLLFLYQRYPTDIRYTDFLSPQYKANSTRIIGYFVDPTSIPSPNGTVRHMPIAVLTDDGAGNYSFTDGGTKYDIEKRKINGESKADDAGEYYEYHVNYGGTDCAVLVAPEMTLSTKGITYPMIFVNKFSYQDGNPMLSSPVVCRWGEVILNRAEAYAHKGQDAQALADVDVIRTRAGIPAAGMFTGNMHGYSSALNVVLDERRLELAFEGHRMFDVYRNKLNMDRRYPGAHPWKIVPYDEPHIQYPIPNNERTVSGIEQNPGY